MVVKIAKEAFDGMIEHAEEGYPHEVCGVMTGMNGLIKNYIRCRNLNRERAHDRYELDPLSFNEADQWARVNGQDIVGIYHSHPDHPSRPSETDRQRAWPEWGYIIFSIREGRYNDARLWYINESDYSFFEKEYEIG